MRFQATLMAVSIGILLAVPGKAVAAIVDHIEFQQLTFTTVDPEVPVEPFSEVGRIFIFYQKDALPGYLNVAAVIPGVSPEPVWIIRNMVMPDFTMGPPTEEVAKRFPLSVLGLGEMEPCPPLNYAISLTNVPFTDQEGEVWALTAALDRMGPVMQVTVAQGAGMAAVVDTLVTQPLPADPAPLFASYQLGLLIENHTMIGCEMHNMTLDTLSRKGDWNGCVPASCANSLHWLNDKHGDIDFPGDERQTFNELSALMNRLYQKGVSVADMARAKLDFIEAHGLPIHVKVQNYFSDGDIPSSSGKSKATDTDGGGLQTLPKKDWLFSEAAKGEDVEICYGFWYKEAGKWKRAGGHAVALSGTSTVLGIPTIHIKHDEKQSDGTGNIQEEVPIGVTPSGGMELLGQGGKWRHTPGGPIYEHRAFVDGVVSESRDPAVTPPPAAETFSGYCQEITRTIPPGKSLYLAFPDVYFRCLNVTIYRWDRSTNPPTQVKEGEWNRNDNTMREMHNTSDVPVTYTFHNDDFVPSIFTYTPWTVGLSIGTPSGTKTTSPYDTGAWGGFSVGWSDSSAAEFGPITAPAVMVDVGPGCNLSDVPARLSAVPGVGVQHLDVYEMVPGWNPGWDQLAFVLDVVEVTSPGFLDVMLQGSGEMVSIPITAPGRYEHQWTWPHPPAPEVHVLLTSQGGLDVMLDCIGLPASGWLSGVEDDGEVPARPVLESIAPNPFNPTTVVRFGVPGGGRANLEVFDIRGRKVATLFEGDLQAGIHEEVWRGLDDAGRSVASGTYVVRLEAGRQVATRKVELAR